MTERALRTQFFLQQFLCFVEGSFGALGVAHHLAEHFFDSGLSKQIYLLAWSNRRHSERCDANTYREANSVYLNRILEEENAVARPKPSSADRGFGFPPIPHVSERTTPSFRRFWPRVIIRSRGIAVVATASRANRSHGHRYPSTNIRQPAFNVGSHCVTIGTSLLGRIVLVMSALQIELDRHFPVGKVIA